MNIDHLREFTELAKHLNFTETARVLGMSQPTLSKHMSALERDLRITLFERAGGQLKLTKTASALIDPAYRVIDAQNEFSQVVRDLRKSPPPHLTVCGLTDEGPSTEMLGFLVARLAGEYGTGFLEVKSHGDKTPVELLAEGAADIVFDPTRQGENLEAAGVQKLLVGRLPLAAFVAKGHPLAERGEISLSDLRECTLLKFEGVYLERSWWHIEAACERHGFAPKTQSLHCANTAELLAACANLGSSVLLVGRNFKDRVPGGIASYCSCLDVTDDDAVVPLYFLYSAENANPVLHAAIGQIEALSDLPMRFD